MYTIEDITDRRFETGHRLGGRRNPRTWFKRFVQLFPEFRDNPRFCVNGGGLLEWRHGTTVIRLDPEVLRLTPLDGVVEFDLNPN